MAQVDVVALRKRYGRAVALDDVTLEAREGEFVTLLGPSGCGKTTTLRLIAGFLEPDGGDIRVDGASVLRTPTERRDFGVVFQNYALFPHLTVAENVAYGLVARRVAAEERRRRVAEALDLVRLTGLEERLPKALSGGQQQRVALARALVIRPRLLLLDEPLANLDARLRHEVRWLIRDVQRRAGTTAFYVTHDQAEAMAMSDRVAVMKGGRVVQFAPPREIYARPAERYVAEFTGEANFLAAKVVAPLGPGMWRVAAGGALLDMPGPAALPGGATLMLRPEALSLAAEGVALEGTLDFVAYLGASQQCEVRLDDGGRLRALLPPHAPLREGGRVRLAVDPAHGWLMPEVAA